MKSSTVLNSRQERTAGSTSHFGNSKAVSGSSAILVGGSSCVAIAPCIATMIWLLRLRRNAVYSNAPVASRDAVKAHGRSPPMRLSDPGDAFFAAFGLSTTAHMSVPETVNDEMAMKVPRSGGVPARNEPTRAWFGCGAALVQFRGEIAGLRIER